MIYYIELARLAPRVAGWPFVVDGQTLHATRLRQLYAEARRRVNVAPRPL